MITDHEVRSFRMMSWPGNTGDSRHRDCGFPGARLFRSFRKFPGEYAPARTRVFTAPSSDANWGYPCKPDNACRMYLRLACGTHEKSRSDAWVRGEQRKFHFVVRVVQTLLRFRLCRNSLCVVVVRFCRSLPTSFSILCKVNVSLCSTTRFSLPVVRLIGSPECPEPAPAKKVPRRTR